MHANRTHVILQLLCSLSNVGRVQVLKNALNMSLAEEQ